MFTIGADPEIFIGQGGHFLSAHGLIPGTKEKPYRVDRGAVQVDGVALEFNIDPATSYQEFQLNLDTVREKLKSMVPNYDFLTDVTVELDPGYKAQLPPEVVEIGCKPDINAYTEETSEGPDPDTNIRAVGGHVHIGGLFGPEDTTADRHRLALRMTRLMDQHVGVYSLLWDKDDRRRSIYGAAGACRIRDYGVEYRSLSNQWLFSPRITKFVYEGTERAFAALRRGEDVETDLYRSIINNSDRGNAFFGESSLARYLSTL